MLDLNSHEMRSGRPLGPSKSLNSNKNALSFDNQDSSFKIRTPTVFDTTMGSEADGLKLEDIEKIKFDLNEEKNKIRFYENVLNKLMKQRKLEEDEIEEEKNYIQKRKDDLTIQERSLLEEKKRFSELQKKFKEDKKNYEQQKEAILNDIDEIRQNILIGKSKNSIHEKKIAEYMKKIMELNNRRDYILSVYSGASNSSINQFDRFSIQKQNDQIFSEDTFQMKMNHEKKTSSSIAPQYNQSNVQMFNPGKGDQEITRNEIQAEKNKIVLMEKDLDNLKALEEQLIKELVEREAKKIKISKAQNAFSVENNQASLHPDSHDQNIQIRGFLKTPK